MSAEILHRVKEQFINNIATPENELLYGTWTTSYHTFLSVASRQLIDSVEHQLDNIGLADVPTEYIQYALYPYLGARMLLGSTLVTHGAYRLRENKTYYKVAAKMIIENVTKIPQKY